MNKPVLSLVTAVLLSMTVSVAPAQSVVSGSNPRPQATQSTAGTVLSAVLAFFGIYTN